MILKQLRVTGMKIPRFNKKLEIGEHFQSYFLEICKELRDLIFNNNLLKNAILLYNRFLSYMEEKRDNCHDFFL